MAFQYILLFGPPGSGKGTQAKKIAKRLKIKHISTGDMFRKEIKKRSQLGRRVAGRLAAGELVSEVTALCMVAEQMEKKRVRDGWLLDGFPRSEFQVEALGKMMADHRLSLDHVINLDVPDNELIARLTIRSEKEKRSDDNPEAIRSRIDFYRLYIEPSLAAYERVGLVRTVSGVGKPDEVYRRICREIGC